MKKRMSVLSLAVLVFVAGLLPAFAAAESPFKPIGPGQNSLLKEWKQSKHTWDSRGIDSYEFTQVNTCFCIYRELQIRVENNQVVSVTDLTTGTALDPGSFANYTIDDYFQTIWRAIGQAETVQVQYNAKHGYPGQVYIDWHSMIADEETSFTITSFQAL